MLVAGRTANAYAKAGGTSAQIPTQTAPSPRGAQVSKTGPVLGRRVTLPKGGWTYDPSSGRSYIDFSILVDAQSARGACAGPSGTGDTEAAVASGSSFVNLLFNAAQPSGSIVTVSPPPGVQDDVRPDVYDTSGSLIERTSLCVVNGFATLPTDNYLEGDYIVAFSLKGSLITKVPLHFGAAAQIDVQPVWHFGDLDGDNYVSQAEVDFVASRVGHEIYEDYGDSPYADFDGDEKITQADLNLAQASLGMHGD